MKIKNYTNIRHRAFLRLFRVNLILCLISILILSVVVLPFLFQSAITNDSSIVETKLQTCRSYLDSEYTYAANLTYFLQQQEWISEVFTNLAAGKPVSYATGKAVTTDLRTFCANHLTISEISLYYYLDPDTIFSRKHFVQNREMMRSLFPENVSYAIFPLNEEDPGFSTVENHGDTYLVFRTPFRTTYSAKAKGEICVFFSEKRLQEKLQELLGNDISSVDICSNNGDVLHTITLADPSDGDSVVSIQSDLYTYQITMPLHSSRSRVIRLIACAIILDLLTCLTLALILTSINYRPFGNIIRQFAGEIPPEKVEFSHLNMSIQKLQDTCIDQEQALAKLQPMVEISAVHQLLNGGFLLYDEIDEELALYGITFPYSLFGVVSISLTELDNAASISAVLDPLVQELSVCPNLVTYLRSFSKNSFHILINYRDEQALENLLTGMERHFNQVGLEQYHMGISSAQQSPEQLYLACEQADTALNSAYLQHCKLERFDALRSPCSKDYYYPLAEEVLLSRAIAENQMDKACEILHNVIDRNCNSSDHQKNLALLFFNLYSTIARSISGLNVQIPYYDSFPCFPFNGTQLYKQLEDLLLSVSAQLTSKKETNTVSLEQQILEYIDDNLFSPDLSLVDIATHFNKSTGYISIIFKRERGTNYNNYVNQKRIEQAVKLLASNTMDLQSICDAVGYTNLSRFTKNFQKYTGHDPF